MKKSILPIITSALILMIFLSACGNSVTPPIIPVATDTAMATLTITTTPDLCAEENIRAEVDKVHKHMREFDDASTLAGSVPNDLLVEPIANLQRIRREAEDELVPTCLASLKQYQIDHMNLVIEALIAFMNASNPLGLECVSIESSEEQYFCQRTALAGERHDQYTLELARILGIPIVTATPRPTPSDTETPSP